MTSWSAPAAESSARIMSELHALLASDGHAATFETVDQYRASMLEFINESLSIHRGTDMTHILTKLHESVRVRAVAMADHELPELRKLSTHYFGFAGELHAVMTDAGIPVTVPPDPMDWPLPCDVVVGAFIHPQGAKLGTLVARMRVLETVTRRMTNFITMGEANFKGADLAPEAANDPILAPTEYEEPLAEHWKLAVETSAKFFADDPVTLRALDYIVALATHSRNFDKQASIAFSPQSEAVAGAGA